MTDFFSSNADYILFFSGVSFIMQASLLFSLAQRKREIIRWKYLGFFSLLYGIFVWLDMIALGFADSWIFAAARVALLAASFLYLLEFGRSGTAAVGARVPGRWIIAVLPAVALAGLYGGIAGINGAVRYIIGLTGSLWSAWVLWRYRSFTRSGQTALTAASAGLVLCGLGVVFAVPRTDIPILSVLNEVSSMAAVRIPVQLSQGILAFATGLAFWRYGRTGSRELSEAGKRQRILREVFLIGVFVTVIAVGYLITTWAGHDREKEKRRDIVYLAKTGVAAMNTQHIARLTGTQADLASPDYLILKKQLTIMKKAVESVRFYYLMRMEGDTAIFLVDSEPESSPAYSPPGQVYDEITAENRAALKSKKPVVVGPYRDRWGIWISALAPVFGNNGRIIATLGIDIEAARWKQVMARERIGAILNITFFSCILLMFYIAQRRSREAREAVEAAAMEQSLLLNTISTQIWYLSDPETYGLVNDAHAAFLGRSAVDVSYRSLGEFLSEQETRRRIESNREVFANGKRVGMEAWIKDGRGDPRLLEVVKTPKLDERGNVEYVVCSAEDITDKKLTEAALKLSEAQFRSYFELPLIGIAITSVEKRWIEVNDRLCEIMGYARKELEDLTWAEMTHPDDLAMDEEQFNRLLSGEIESYSLDKRFIRKGGEVVWTSLAVGCVRNPDRTVDFMLALIQDISDRKRAEAGLKASEERYRLITENSSDVIWTMTLDGRFQYVSPSVMELAGFTPEEVMGIPLDRYIVAGYLPGVMAELTKELQKPIEERIHTKTLDIQQYTKDGSIIDIEVTTSWIINEKGEPVGIQGASRDISKRKRAEEELRDREETLNTITGSARDGIVMIDNAGNISFWNEAATRIFGYERDEVMSLNLHELIIPDRYVDSFRSHFPHFQITGEGAAVGKTLELAAIRKDGAEIPVDLSLSSMQLKGRWCAVGIIRDIIDRKKAEEELAKSLEEKGSLLRELQHRVKNSLTMIVGLVDLESHRVDDPATQQVLEQLRDRVMSLSKLYDLLYRSEDVREVRLDQYLDQICRSISESYIDDSDRIALTAKLSEVRVKVKSAIPLGIAVNEILTNALKYAFPDGRRGEITVNLHDEVDTLVIEVSDNGTGMPLDDTKESKGMGSQLIKMMIHQLRGSISIEGGNGTRYRIEIPKVKL
jgi:PAS domain S-box-containing protein